MDEIFRTRHPRVDLSLQDERALILQAQNGDKDAQWQLLLQYSPLLRVASDRLQTRVHTITPTQLEDIQSEMVLATLEAIQNFDHDRYVRLSGLLPKVVQEVTSNWTTALTIPSGTLGRWYKIWRQAGQDLSEAVALAPNLGMSANTFRAIYYSLYAHDSDWVVLPFTAGNPTPDIETHRLAHLALDTLTPTERELIEYAYGFRGDPKSDQEVANIMGMNREAVKKRRVRILEKLRPVVE